MIKVCLAFFLFSFSFQALAEILSIPENCLTKEISPCLIKTTERQVLQGHSKNFMLTTDENTVVKVLQFETPIQIKLLQGRLTLRSGLKKALVFQLNDVKFESIMLFAGVDQDKKMKVYDAQNFILSAYDLPTSDQDEVVISKSEFLSKLDMIRFLSAYFPEKKSLQTYLHSIENNWKKELEIQAKSQTIALKRSIASIEESQNEEKRRHKAEEAELKKVREMFFYRTFYR